LRSLLFHVCLVSHFVCMRNELGNVVLVQRIENIPEVVSVGKATFRQFIRKVLHEVRVGLHHGPELLYRKLVVNRHVYELNVLEFE